MAKAKGTTLIGAVRYLRKNKDRATQILAPELHHYLTEKVSESRWYPEEDLHGVLAAMLELIPGDRDEVLARLGEASAREHLEGIYSHLSGGRSRDVAKRAFALWSSQHDTGRFEVENVSDTEAIMSVRDFGHPSEIMCGILGGYLAESLRVDGAVDIKMQKTACVLRGDPVCSWRRTWARSEGNKPKR